MLWKGLYNRLQAGRFVDSIATLSKKRPTTYKILSHLEDATPENANLDFALEIGKMLPIGAAGSRKIQLSNVITSLQRSQRPTLHP